MKLFRSLSLPMLGSLIAVACTPIAPSIHKSVLKGGDSQSVRPAPSPSARGGSPAQRLGIEVRDPLIEVRWIRDDDALSQELDTDTHLELRKASKDELGLIRKEGLVKIDLFPTDPEAKEFDKDLPLRIILRVQSSEERLLALLDEEGWSFSWDGSSRRTLLITHSAPKSAVAESLVSIHLVTDR